MAKDREFKFRKQDFTFLSELIYESTGIVLSDKKFEMVYGRLARRLRKLGFATFDEYIAFLEGDASGEEMSSLVDALTTNLTKFFREDHQLKMLVNDILKPALALSREGGPKKLRIWSAGCSSGQEVYSIAMVIAATIPDFKSWDIIILGTDIDRNMLNKATSGDYTATDITSLPENFRKRFLEKNATGYSVKPALKKMTTFKSLNLLHAWPFTKKFDVIFCRNVVIYFDTPTKEGIVKNFAKNLDEGGWLFMGHSESMIGKIDELKSQGKAAFIRVAK